MNNPSAWWIQRILAGLCVIRRDGERVRGNWCERDFGDAAGDFHRPHFLQDVDHRTGAFINYFYLGQTR